MSQHDYTIANQGFPATRADINNALSAIATNNSGTSAPSTQYAGQFWIDTTTTTWTLYIHDGADDIQFATIDTSANTVNFIDSALDVVTDTTPQLGGDLDANGNNILFDDATGINDDDDNELIRFQKTSSAVNQIDITNSATGNAPEISATGDDTNIDLKFTPKGTGNVISNSNILFDTASKGIYLGVTTATASNLLDDYEEGTFTPTITSGFVAGVTYALQGGTYTKIGRQVFFTLRLEIGTGTGDGNIITISGLPFTTASSPSGGFAGAAVFTYVNVNIINSTTTNPPTFYISQNATGINAYRTTGSPFVGTDLSVPTNADFYLTGQYLTD